LIEQGFSPESIAVLSFRGAKNSKVLENTLSELNGLTVRKQMGRDPKSGDIIWSDGALLVDTLFRFKGQCADAIVLTEIDINEWDLFWERVGEYHDFNLDTTNYGYKIRAVFPVIVWSCISIELSSATQQVDEMYNDFEYDHEPDPMFHSREKVDSYILDQALNTEPYNRF
jgi:hypothetical protein